MASTVFGWGQVHQHSPGIRNGLTLAVQDSPHAATTVPPREHVGTEFTEMPIFQTLEGIQPGSAGPGGHQDPTVRVAPQSVVV